MLNLHLHHYGQDFSVLLEIWKMSWSWLPSYPTQEICKENDDNEQMEERNYLAGSPKHTSKGGPQQKHLSGIHNQPKGVDSAAGGSTIFCILCCLPRKLCPSNYKREILPEASLWCLQKIKEDSVVFWFFVVFFFYKTPNQIILISCTFMIWMICMDEAKKKKNNTTQLKLCASQP